MGQNKEQLNKLLEFIDSLSQDPENAWFIKELGRKYGSSYCFASISRDVKEIRSALQIRGDNSIKYEYVKNNVLRNQLLVDNLRMENYAFDLKSISEVERFYFFCVNAFYQIENLINYYYHVKYPKIDDLLTQIEVMTASLKYPFTRTGKEETVGDVVIEKKINAFCAEFFPYDETMKDDADYTVILLSNLRLVRNEGFHRCDVILKDKNEKLYNFFKHQDFNTIRALLKKVSAKICEELNKPLVQEGVVVSVLPSAVCVKYQNGENDCITSSVKEFSAGDKIIVVKDMISKKIISFRKK